MCASICEFIDEFYVTVHIHLHTSITTLYARQVKTGGYGAYSTGRNLNIVVCISHENNIIIIIISGVC